MYLRKKYNKKPLLVAADIYRPAAVQQLQTIGKQLSLPVFSLGTDISPVEIVTSSIGTCKRRTS